MERYAANTTALEIAGSENASITSNSVNVLPRTNIISGGTVATIVVLSLCACTAAAFMLWRNSKGCQSGDDDVPATVVQIDTRNDVVYLTPCTRNPEYNYAPQTKSNIVYAIPLEAVGGSNSSSTAFATPPPEYAVFNGVFHRRGNTSTMQNKSHAYVDDGFYSTDVHGTRSGGASSSSGGSGAGKTLRASNRLGVNQVYGDVDVSSNRNAGKQRAAAAAAAQGNAAPEDPAVAERELTKRMQYVNLSDGNTETASTPTAAAANSATLSTAETAC